MSKDAEYLSAREIERLTGIKVATLRNWRFLRKGFSFVRIGRTIRYRWVDVLRYMEERKVDPVKK